MLIKPFLSLSRCLLIHIPTQSSEALFRDEILFLPQALFVFAHSLFLLHFLHTTRRKGNSKKENSRMMRYICESSASLPQCFSEVIYLPFNLSNSHGEKTNRECVGVSGSTLYVQSLICVTCCLSTKCHHVPHFIHTHTLLAWQRDMLCFRAAQAQMIASTIIIILTCFMSFSRVNFDRDIHILFL